MTPKASVLLRSHNRIEAAFEAVASLGEQDYASFEVVILEQSERLTSNQAERLSALERDARVRVVRSRPLGGPGSRNEAVRQSRGEVVVFLDDDDLPASAGWLSAHMRNYDDPRCLAVTGRQIYPDGREPPYWNMARARRLVLSYSPLMWQRCYVRSDRRSTTVKNMVGTNSSVRRSVIDRFGFWDECTKVEDELSFCYRVMAGKRADEYFVFDPEAVILRGLDIPGGLDKRWMTTAQYGEAVFELFHNIVAHYHPVRFVLLYPCYVAMLARVTAGWVITESHRHRTVLQKGLGVVGLLLALPLLWTWWLARWTAHRLAHGAPARAV